MADFPQDHNNVEEAAGPSHPEDAEASTETPAEPPANPLASPEPVHAPPTSAHVDEGEQEIVVDTTETDSGFGGDDDLSDTTSLGSSLIRGHIENGRKYATLRDDYWGPSDEKQFETMDAGHFLYLILESGRSNMLFRSPVSNPQHVIDIGTGPGTWAIDVADKFPEAVVYGVDLYPPPNNWVPPNCSLQVDDVLQEWTWPHKFDLIHMRLLLGAFTDSEWDKVYRRSYENLEPGGWIEQVELDVHVMSDDGTLREDCLLASWGETFLGCAERAERPLSTQTTMKSRIEKAGFVNVQDHLFKCPIGAWPRDRVLKEAGRINLEHWSAGLEGWAMWLLTKYGAPEPWSADEVRVYVSRVRQELRDPRLHIYHYTRRVWGQKPYTTY